MGTLSSRALVLNVNNVLVTQQASFHYLMKLVSISMSLKYFIFIFIFILVLRSSMASYGYYNLLSDLVNL